MVVTAECAWVSQCYGAEASVVLGGRDCTTYETSNIGSSDFADYTMLVSSMKVAYDGTMVAACLAALSTQSCTSSNEQPDACTKVFVGSTAVGGSCTDDVECQNDGVCVGHGMCPGVCTARVPSGTTCTNTSQCARGLVCAATMAGAATMSCVTPAAEGQSCDQGSPPCAGLLYCAGENQKNATAGTCKQASEVFTAAMGSACDPTKSELCVMGSFCAISVTGMTVSYSCVGPSSAGGACQVSYPDSCPSGQYCNADPSMGMFNGTCTAVPADGSPCTGSTPCGPTSVCDGGTCRPMQALGGACTSAIECYSGQCTGGVCVADSNCFSL
jgi:hypothetical protein